MKKAPSNEKMNITDLVKIITDKNMEEKGVNKINVKEFGGLRFNFDIADHTMYFEVSTDPTHQSSEWVIELWVSVDTYGVREFLYGMVIEEDKHTEEEYLDLMIANSLQDAYDILYNYLSEYGD